MKHNPYIGPRPYGRGEGNFFGREREGKELAWLILAEQAVLFYAQSGAGKTSLLNARVIPILEKKGMRVLPVARVGSGLPASIAPEQVENIFVFSALLGLAAETDIPPEALLKHSLLSYLQEYGPRPPTADQPSTLNPQPQIPNPQSPTLLILDQFEEIATTHREHWAQAEGFFHQLRAALDVLPGLAVLFVLREDYVAELDPYTPLLPSHLQARFRMTLPTRAQAMQIVRGPAEQAGVPFAEEAAENLVTNLSRIKTPLLASPLPGGTEGGNIGQYVEPVQLQVVCQQLWESLPESVREDGVITWDEIKHYNVDDALTSFYESTLTTVRNQVFERQLRGWFSEALITPEERRGLALQAATETGGLPNAVVAVLENHHLIRSELRAGSRWYELAHDRLVPSIVQSNRDWEAAQDQTHPWRPIARQWRDVRSETLLYRGKELETAQGWLDAASPGDVEPYEREFIQASQQARRERARMRAWRTGLFALLAILVAVLSVQPIRGWYLRQRALRVRKTVRIEFGQVFLGDARLFEIGDAMEAKPYTGDDFFMEIHEVTNDQYLLCVAARVCSPPNAAYASYADPQYRDRPVVHVTAIQASQFCRWIGRRLPTELEWERAARGPLGAAWPWGDAAPTTPEQAYLSYGDPRLEAAQDVGRALGDRSAEGVYDLAGNVWEWTCTPYDAAGYDPQACVDLDRDFARRIVIKGGDFSATPDGVQRTLAYHGYIGPERSYQEAGFRCVETP